VKLALKPGELAFTIDALPEASTLARGTRVYVLPDDVRVRGFLAAFSRRTIARSARCNALLLLGYADLGATVDEKTKTDLVFGTA
jgi:hypothetical protein